MTSALTEAQTKALADVGLAAFSMRPTFQFQIAMDADHMAKRIQQVLETTEFRDYVKSKGKSIDFTIEPRNQRFWSPHLSVQLSHSDTGSHVFGRFSARPEIWTMFFVIYEVMAVTAFGAAIYGYVQWALNSDPWALILVPFGILVIVMLHIASLIGQRLSTDQIRILTDRFKSVLEMALENSSSS